MYKIIITGVSKYNDKYDEQIVGLRKKCGVIGFVICAEGMNAVVKMPRVVQYSKQITSKRDENTDSKAPAVHVKAKPIREQAKPAVLMFQKPHRTRHIRNPAALYSRLLFSLVFQWGFMLPSCLEAQLQLKTFS